MANEKSPTVETIGTFSTIELMAWFNANSNAPRVKRFADRASAERRVLALVERLAASSGNKGQPVGHTRRAAAVRASWNDSKTRRARSARHMVRADGTLYESTLKAFRALRLDPKAHQRVRRQLVLNGKVEHEGHKFLLAPKDE